MLHFDMVRSTQKKQGWAAKRSITGCDVDDDVAPGDGQRHEGVEDDEDDEDQRIGLTLDPAQHRMNVVSVEKKDEGSPTSLRMFDAISFFLTT